MPPNLLLRWAGRVAARNADVARLLRQMAAWDPTATGIVLSPPSPDDPRLPGL